MLLSEKEMERIIASCFGMACPEKAAAHAIAERMKAGVVVSLNTEVTEVSGTYAAIWASDQERGIYITIDCYGEDVRTLAGQRVNVTVIKLEGEDADKNA